MSAKRTLSSPNCIVWELFGALRRLCTRCQEEEHGAQDKSAARQDAALCVMLAVQCVEVFFNVFFRVLVSEPAYAHAAERVLADLARREVSLQKKIDTWPALVFGRELPRDSAAWQRFDELKSLRNTLMHFKSTHETIFVPGVEIHGAADTTAYDSLSARTAREALDTAEAFLREVFALRGVRPEELLHQMHGWTGRPPI